jgi:hypothetical protein
MMLVDTAKFRVPEGGTVELKRWPTRIDPIYRSDDDYADLLSRDVADLSASRKCSTLRIAILCC